MNSLDRYLATLEGKPQRFLRDPEDLANDLNLSPIAR